MPDHPVTCIDFCDALAYCDYYGKRLCGALGDGGVVNHVDATNPTLDEWTYACGGPSGQNYPYGPDASITKCATADSANGLVDVGTFSGCTGFEADLHDMSGNALEWEDAYGSVVGDGGAPFQNAYARGGSYENPTVSASCKYVTPPYRRDATYPNIGFRCCAAP